MKKADESYKKGKEEFFDLIEKALQNCFYLKDWRLAYLNGTKIM